MQELQIRTRAVTHNSSRNRTQLYLKNVEINEKANLNRFGVNLALPVANLKPFSESVI